MKAGIIFLSPSKSILIKFYNLKITEFDNIRVLIDFV